jgi:hypothetical protein
VSPRRTRPARRTPGEAAGDAGETSLTGGFESVEVDAGGHEWKVRHITGSSSTKTYRCPGCDHEIRPATPHVVAWPVEAIEERRHWHAPCWRARARRSMGGRF